MKKILLMAAVAMMTAMSVQAQNNGYETKHEVAVSYGIDSNSIVAFGQSTQDVMSGNYKIGESKNTYYTLMPAVKFDWLRKKHFGMYSKAAVGATLRNEKYNSDVSSSRDYNDSEVHVNWQASFLGIEVGSPTLRGFVELGTGEQGIILAGVRCKF